MTHWAVGTSCARTLPLVPSRRGSVRFAATPFSWSGVIESLTAAAQGRTVVIGVDDVHLLDDLSTFVVHQIVQRRAAKVVLTVRDGEPISAGTQELWEKSVSSNGSICNRYRPTRPLRCCQPLWADRWTRTTPAGSGSARGNVLYLRTSSSRRSPTAGSRNSMGSGTGPAIRRCRAALVEAD